MQEFYRKHRPKSWDEVHGQDRAVAQLKHFVGNGGVPHALLFTGPSGVGKTTAARILRREVGCSTADLREINTASTRGIDMVREIIATAGMAPINGRCRLWIIDEAHGLTPDAQEALLKVLEDPPAHAYFVICTTLPNKLKPTIHTRCTEVKFAPLPPKSLEKAVRHVLKREKASLSEEVLDRLVESADGSARKALVVLQQVLTTADEAEQLQIIQRADSRQAAFDIYRLLISKRSRWPEVAKVLQGLEEEEPEGIRQLVMACARTDLLKGKDAPRANQIIARFENPFHDSGKKTNHALLASACYDVVTGGG